MKEKKKDIKKEDKGWRIRCNKNNEEIKKGFQRKTNGRYEENLAKKQKVQIRN